MVRMLILAAVTAFVVALAGCAGESASPDIPAPEGDYGGGSMEISSSSFQDSGDIPAEHTCDGEDVSPELSISGVPEGSKSLALVMEDPDAPTGNFVHWLAWNIPPETKTINRGEEPEGSQGTNDFGNAGYGGPRPPSGTHRYYFRLYALDTTLDVEQGASKDELESAIEGHVIDKAELMGRYSRQA